jgi:hypothetical protein
VGGNGGNALPVPGSRNSSHAQIRKRRRTKRSEIVELLRTRSSNPEEDVSSFVDSIIFNWLIRRHRCPRKKLWAAAGVKWHRSTRTLLRFGKRTSVSDHSHRIDDTCHEDRREGWLPFLIRGIHDPLPSALRFSVHRSTREIILTSSHSPRSN